MTTIMETTANKDFFRRTFDAASGRAEATFKGSCAMALFAILNWRIGLAVAGYSHANLFAADLALSALLYSGFAVFWIPVTHLFAGGNSAGAKSLVRESNVATAVLALALPLGLLMRAFSLRAPMTAADIILRLFFVWRVSSAVTKIYSVSRVRSLLIVAAPGAVFIFWSLTASAAAVIKLWQLFG